MKKLLTCCTISLLIGCHTPTAPSSGTRSGPVDQIVGSPVQVADSFVQVAALSGFEDIKVQGIDIAQGRAWARVTNRRPDDLWIVLASWDLRSAGGSVQTLHDAQYELVRSGDARTFSIDLPDCFYQVDLIKRENGDPLPATYHWPDDIGALIRWLKGGHACPETPPEEPRCPTCLPPPPPPCTSDCEPPPPPECDGDDCDEPPCNGDDCSGTPACELPDERTFCVDKPLGNPEAECDAFGLEPTGKDDDLNGTVHPASQAADLAIVKAGLCYRLVTDVSQGDQLASPTNKDISHVTYCSCPEER